MELLYNIIEFVACLVDGGLAVVFLWLLCGRKRHISKCLHIVISIIVTFIMGCIAHFITDMPIQLIGLLIVLSIYSYFLLYGTVGKKIYFVILWNVLLMLSSFFMVYGLSTILGIPQDLITQPASITRVLMLIIHKILIVCIMYIMVAYNKRYKFDYKQWLITVTQFLSVLLVGAIFIELYSRNAFDDKSSFEIVLIAIILSIMCVVVCICQHILNIQNIYKIENDRLKSYLEEEEHNIKRIEEMYEASSIIRHDMKHYVVVMNNMLEEEKYNDLKTMIDELSGGQLLGANVIYTSDNSLNAVLNNKLAICKQNGIELLVQISCMIPKNIMIDICVILSNLLDNAIEAEKQEKSGYIKTNISMRGNMLNISVVNMVTEPVLIKNPGLNTTKKDKDRHGFGLRSVSRRVDDLDGIYTYKEEEGEFKTIIQIPVKL